MMTILLSLRLRYLAHRHLPLLTVQQLCRKLLRIPYHLQQQVRKHIHSAFSKKNSLLNLQKKKKKKKKIN